MTLLSLFLLLACDPEGEQEDTAVDLPVDLDEDGVPASVDCDDTDADVGEPSTWFVDGDGDGYGDPDFVWEHCDQPDGYVSDDLDCGPLDPNVFPGADEVCDEVDQDCDAIVDEEPTDAPLRYADSDGDGYGDDDAPVEQCSGEGLSDRGGDCDDTDGGVNPQAEEICGNGVDDNCDGGAPSCSLSGDVILEHAHVVVSGSEEEDGVGGMVYLSEDLTGDGQPDLVLRAGSDDVGRREGILAVLSAPITAGATLTDADVTVVPDPSFSLESAVVDAADINGDGAQDLVVGTGLTQGPGAIWIFEGPLSGTLTGEDTIAQMVGVNGIGVGGSVAWLGDVDGDAVEDLLVGAPYDTAGGYSAGAAFLVLGPIEGELDVRDQIKLEGESGDITGYGYHGYAGKTVAGPGDVDGDGFDDLLIGSETDPSGGALYEGTAYLLRGPVTASMSLEDADMRFRGPERTWGGAGVHGPGDVDGDGKADLFIGSGDSTYYDIGGGFAWILLDPPDGDLFDEDAAIRFIDTDEDYPAGPALASGDIDGDGEIDVLVSAPHKDQGVVYLMLGPFGGTHWVSDATAMLRPEESFAYGLEAGLDMSSGVDLDGNGTDEILVGMPLAGELKEGSACLFYGGL